MRVSGAWAAHKAWLGPLLWIAYLIVPIDGWGLFSGRPIGGVSSVALAVLCWLWWTRRSIPPPMLALAALAAKLLLGGVLLAPRGFDARYYANADFAAPLEKGTEPASSSLTRIDRQLSFLGVDRDLPVYFFNDNRRFNFYLPTEPVREYLPVSAVWEGWLRVPRTGLWRLWVRAPTGQVTMSVGDHYSVTIPRTPTEWVGYPPLTRGLSKVRIALSIPQGGTREFAAGWTVDGLEVPFGEAMVYRQPAGWLRRLADSTVRAGSTIFDVLLCAWLLAGVVTTLASAWRRLTLSPGVRDALVIGWSLVIVDTVRFAWPRLHRMITLSGGDDWLTYETRARDIALNSIWMLNGMTLGQGTPFFEMPFYPYFLAGTHWLFGDDLYGAVFVQRLMLGAAAFALWRVTATLFGERVGCAGLVTALVIVYEKVAARSGMLLTELLFVPLVCVLTLLLVRLARSEQPSWRLAAAAGAIGGAATLTRSTLMTAWPVVLLLVLISLRPAKRALRTVALLAAVMMAVISLATIRNWVVSHKFVLINAYGSFNLFLANVPQGEIPVPADRKAEYDRLHLDRHLQMVVENARNAPDVFFDRFRRRAYYAFGYFTPLDPEQGVSIFYVATCVVGLLGVLWLISPPSWLPRAGPASLIPLSLALTHLAVLIMTFPNVYGDRLLLTFYALLTPYVAIVAYAVHRGLWSVAGRATGLIPLLALLMVGGLRWSGRLSSVNVPLLVLAAGVWGLCAYGVPRLPSIVKRRSALSLWLAILATVFAAGCAPPPSGDVRLAKETLDKALAAGAERHAAESLNAARLAQAALAEELKLQSAKWVKSYDRARDLAIAAQAAADKAASDALARKAEALVIASTVAPASAAGSNLFQNGDFADGLNGWGVHPDADATVTIDVTGNERIWHVNYRKGNWSVIHQSASLQPDTVYVYEAMIRSTAPVVALYWQAETGRFHGIDKTYPEWTHLRYVIQTPHWTGKPYAADFMPILMKGPGEAWLKDLRLSEFKPQG